MNSWRAELVERVAREMCDAWEPRVLAEKEEAPTFDDSEPGVQIFWRKQAEIALSIALPAMREPEAEADDHAAAVVRWREEAGRLRETLEPFARLGRLMEGPFEDALFPDDRIVDMGGGWSENGEPRTVTFGDLRRARLALGREG